MEKKRESNGSCVLASHTQINSELIQKQGIIYLIPATREQRWK
jgi:hypothetical protein